MTKPYKTLKNNKHFDLIDPDSSLIDIEYIASVLSNINRFGGEVRYSVGQHSINCYRYIKTYWPNDFNLQLAALLHDSSEVYICGDIISTQKEFLYFKIDGDKLISYKKLENRLLGYIFKKFEIDTYREDLIKEADINVLNSEFKALLPNRTINTGAVITRSIPDICEFNYWAPEKTEIIFIRTFEKLKKLLD